MKYALFALFCALSFSTAASADPLELPEAQPLRMAHAAGTIRQQLATDYSSLDISDLCSFDGDVPVYPDPSTFLGQRLKQYVKVCDVAFGGKDMRVQLSLNVFEFSARERGGKKIPARKTLQAMIFVFEKGSGDIFYTQVTGASSEDLSVGSLGAFTTPSVFEGAKLPEGSLLFSADIHLTDSAR